MPWVKSQEGVCWSSTRLDAQHHHWKQEGAHNTSAEPLFCETQEAGYVCGIRQVLTSGCANRARGLKFLQYLLKMHDQPSANLFHNYFAQGECFITQSLLQETCAGGDLHTFQYIMAGCNFNNYFRGIAEANSNLPKSEAKGNSQDDTNSLLFSLPSKSHTTSMWKKKKSFLTTIWEDTTKSTPCSPGAGTGYRRVTYNTYTDGTLRNMSCSLKKNVPTLCLYRC